MNRAWVVSVGLVTVLCAPFVAMTSASAAPTPVTISGHSVCRHTTYTGDGGFFDQGTFHWQPSETVTLTVDWCSSGGVITSKHVTFTSTIPGSEDPRLTESDGLTRGGAVLKASVGGDYDSGVINNVGFILLAGHVSADGHRHFKNLSAAGG
jgi:hypothetical protein